MEVGKIKKVIPEGTRDYTIEECFKRNKIIEKIKNSFRLWGYREVSTPTIEYFDNFNSSNKKTYSIFGLVAGSYTLSSGGDQKVICVCGMDLTDGSSSIILQITSDNFDELINQSIMGQRNLF